MKSGMHNLNTTKNVNKKHANEILRYDIVKVLAFSYARTMKF